MKYAVYIIALVFGAVLCFLNYLLSRYYLKKHSKVYGASAIIRQVICVAYLTALFFIGENSGYTTWGLLLCGALGITLPSVPFTMSLLRIEKEDKNG